MKVTALVASENQCIANNLLLDFIAQQCGFKRDRQLAAALDISPSMLSKTRHGTIPIGATLQLTMLIAEYVTLKQLRRYVPSSLISIRNKGACMKLYELPRGSYFTINADDEGSLCAPPGAPVPSAGVVYRLERVDGHYSSCFDEAGKLAHVAVYASVTPANPSQLPECVEAA